MTYNKPHEFREEILKLFESKPYVLIGQVATLSRCSLDDAESYLIGLEVEGLIRLATGPEARKLGVRYCYVIVPRSG